MSEMPLVLTIEEAAKLLRIGRGAAYELARRGELPVVRLGRTLRVPRHRLDELLNGGANGAPQTNGAGGEPAPERSPDAEGLKQRTGRPR